MASNEVCEDNSCVDAPVIEPCEDPGLSAVSLPIPGLADAVAMVFAESDGSPGTELVALAGSTVRVADAIPTGIPVITTVEVPGKEDLVGVVAWRPTSMPMAGTRSSFEGQRGSCCWTYRQAEDATGGLLPLPWPPCPPRGDQSRPLGTGFGTPRQLRCLASRLCPADG